LKIVKSRRICDDKVIFSVITRVEMEQFGVKSSDLDGIVAQMRNTKDVETAIFLYETGEEAYKVSMRSNDSVNVSRIAVLFGGGGHVKAAGCSMQGSADDIIAALAEEIQKQLTQEQNQ